MSSLKRTSRADAYAHPNRSWPPTFSSLRKRTEASTSSRTTVKKDNLVLGLFSLSSFTQQDLSSTSLITASGFIINSLKGLKHIDYVIRVCPYYIISLTSA